MKAEIIAVGTEVLMGQVINTNASYLSEELIALGFDVYYHSVVGDNEKRLLDVLTLASGRSDLVVLCGGLGPTQDDITRETLAKYLGEELVLNEEGYNKIKESLDQSNKKMMSNNKRQALVIANALSLSNPMGFAVGSFYQGETNYLLLPGPPRELKVMFQENVKPVLKQLLPQTSVLESRVLRYFGIGESVLVSELEGLIASQKNPTIAPYVELGEVRLRLSAQASNPQKAIEALDSLEKEINQRVGDFLYGYGETNSLVAETVKVLAKEGLTLSVAESLTAGLVQSTLASVPGVSEIFKGGVVTYSNEMKQELLGVSKKTLREHGAVSHACAKEMAERVRKITKTDIGLSLTGVAGPSEVEGKKVGTVYIGISTQAGTKSQLFYFKRDREYIRHLAMLNGLNIIREKVKKK